MLFLDGVYVSNKANKLAFKQVKAPTKDQLQTVVQRISERLAKLLTRQGLLTQDDESTYLTLDALDDNALHHLQSHSVTYRVAVGPQQGKNVNQRPKLSTCQRPKLSSLAAISGTTFMAFEAIRVITGFQDVAMMGNTVLIPPAKSPEDDTRRWKQVAAVSTPNQERFAR